MLRQAETSHHRDLSIARNKQSLLLTSARLGSLNLQQQHEEGQQVRHIPREAEDVHGVVSRVFSSTVDTVLSVTGLLDGDGPGLKLTSHAGPEWESELAGRAHEALIDPGICRGLH